MLLISIVVPTYNERESLPELFERLDAALAKVGDRHEIVVVDDDSPDGTWRVAEQLAGDHPVRVIRRTQERGLATAALAGARAADGDTVVVMDADLQHPPETVPHLVEAIEAGADVAVGSRRVADGSMATMGPLRRSISWGAELLARTLFRRVRGIGDLQSGFFAVRREVFEDAELDPRGYKILLELLVVGAWDEAVEVGYVFEDRKHGASKLGADDVVDYVLHLASLSYRSRELHRFVAFGIVGAIGVLVNLGVLETVLALGTPGLVASAAGIEAGLLSNFTLNRAWTFRDRDVSGFRATLRSLGRDHLVRSGGIGITLAVFWTLTTLFGFVPVLAQLAGVGCAMLWNFAGNTWWTWET